MNLLGINLSNKFKNHINKCIYDLSIGKYKLEPQMYNYYLNKLLILTTPFEFLNKLSKFENCNKIGPHNIDILSIIFGSLLGNAQAEKFRELNHDPLAGGRGQRSSGGTKIQFFQENTHTEYIFFLHKMISYLNYCYSKKPVAITKLGSKGKIIKEVKFSTWSYLSFNEIYSLWYKNNVKYVPENINLYLTPLALAVWVMDNGAKVGNSLKFSNKYFTYNCCLILVKALNKKFNLKASIELTGSNKHYYTITILKESMEDLRKIIYPYVIPEMKYKII